MIQDNKKHENTNQRVMSWQIQNNCETQIKKKSNINISELKDSS